ncbi:MAG: MATE family efflux transporter [Butyrivibrio sp.]|nr:MATE family efflux transporter [Butyrivibrio sp.]
MAKNNITEGSIWQNMLVYFFTLLLGAFFQQFYNTIDAIIVGRAVSSDALAAVGGSSAMVVSLFLGFFLGLSSGASVVISQFYGAGRRQEVEKAVHTAIALALTGGFILMIVGILISSWIINVMNTPAETVEASTMYLRIYFLGMIPNFVYNIGAGILRAVGDSKRPLIVLIISCFANIFLDLFFVVLLGFGKKGDTYGTIGVAIATVLCQLLSAVIIIVMLARTEESYRFDPKKTGFDLRMLHRIISIGLPAGFQTTMYTLSNIIIQVAINEFGKDAASAWAAYGKIDVLFWMTISSLGTAATTFVGQNYGAGKYDRVRRCVREAFALAAVITIPLATILYFSGNLLLRVFVTNEEVITIGIQMLRFLAPFYITYVGVEIFSSSLRGMGDALIPMLITLSGICILRVVWILFVFPHNKTIEMVETSYPITWITTSILFLIYYLFYTKKKLVKR